MFYNFYLICRPAGFNSESNIESAEAQSDDDLEENPNRPNVVYSETSSEDESSEASDNEDIVKS